MDTVTCPRCGTENPASAVNCRDCRVNLRFALEDPEQLGGTKLEAPQREEDGTQQEASQAILTVLRWIARILSIAFIGVFVLMFAGEGFDPAKITPREWVSLLFFPFGVVAGMILAWWKEGLGGAITIASLLATYFVGDVSSSGGAHMAVCASPGFLFLLCWFLSKATGVPNHTEREMPPEPLAGLPDNEKEVLHPKATGVPNHTEREMPPEPLAGLTDNEKEVLHLISEGLRNLEIADRLGISGVQASLTTSELLKRFGVDNKDELINQARQQGHLPPN